MSCKLTGPSNPNWNGGVTTDPRGYVLVKEPSHHRADVRGYVYQHVLMAEESIGRQLEPWESVRRHDTSKPFAMNNLRVVGKPPAQRRACACGCGEAFDSRDSSGRERHYVSGHNTAHDGPPLGKSKRYGLGIDEYWMLFDQFGGFCAYACGRSATSIDHIRPRSKGGSNSVLNLVPACRSCNSSKHDRDWLRWVFVGANGCPDGWVNILESIGSLTESSPLEWADDEFWEAIDALGDRTWDEMPEVSA